MLLGFLFILKGTGFTVRTTEAGKNNGVIEKRGRKRAAE